MDPDGDGQLDPLTIYCDMSTDCGGWTLVSYCNSTLNVDNLYDLQCGGGTYHPIAWNTCASLGSVPFAKQWTELLFTRSNSTNKTGNILQYTVANKFGIPNLSAVNFVNHSQFGSHTGNGPTDRGACVPVTLTTIKGADHTGMTRYTFQSSLGGSWGDSFLTGCGAIANSNCTGTWSQGPFFISLHSGSGKTAGDFNNACVSDGHQTYNHQSHYDPNGAGHSGSVSSWLR